MLGLRLLLLMGGVSIWVKTALQICLLSGRSIGVVASLLASESTSSISAVSTSSSLSIVSAVALLSSTVRSAACCTASETLLLVALALEALLATVSPRTARHKAAGVGVEVERSSVRVHFCV